MIHPGDRIYKTISGFIFFHFRSPCRMLILEVLSAFHLLSLFCSMLDFLRQIGSKCRKSHPQTRQTILPYHLLPEPVIMGCSTVMIVPRVKMVLFFKKKQVDDIYTIIWWSWYLTYIDVLSIFLTSEFSLYGKRNVVFFFFIYNLKRN